MSNEDVLDSKLEEEKVEVTHEFSFGRNKIVLNGVFAWVLYINLTIWFLNGLSFLIKDIIALIK